MKLYLLIFKPQFILTFWQQTFLECESLPYQFPLSLFIYIELRKIQFKLPVFLFHLFNFPKSRTLRLKERRDQIENNHVSPIEVDPEISYYAHIDLIVTTGDPPSERWSGYWRILKLWVSTHIIFREHEGAEPHGTKPGIQSCP